MKQLVYDPDLVCVVCGATGEGVGFWKPMFMALDFGNGFIMETGADDRERRVLCDPCHCAECDEGVRP